MASVTIGTADGFAGAINPLSINLGALFEGIPLEDVVPNAAFYAKRADDGTVLAYARFNGFDFQFGSFQDWDNLFLTGGITGMEIRTESGLLVSISFGSFGGFGVNGTLLGTYLRSSNPTLVWTELVFAGDTDYTGDDSSDRIDGFGGNDRLAGAGGRDTLRGSDGNDTLDGDDGKDQLFGGNDRDLLRGGADRDSLFGGTGQDELIGGTGKDVLKGGIGDDAFIFDAALGPSNVDRITDFQLGDRIGLNRQIFDNIPGNALSGRSFGNGAVAETRGERILYDRETGILRYDADGRGGDRAVIFAELEPGTVLTRDDFFLI